MDASQISASVKKSAAAEAPGVKQEVISPSTPTEDSSKSTRRKRSTKARDKEEAALIEVEGTQKSPRKKRLRSTKTQAVVETPDPSSSSAETPDQKSSPYSFSDEKLVSEPPQEKKRTQRVGQRKPKRDPVG